jgi:hypothetical protein
MNRTTIAPLALVLALALLAGCDNADRDIDVDTDGDDDDGTGGQTGPIPTECDGCVSTGSGLENMLCAFDICDPETFVDQGYASPTGSTVAGTYAAVSRFGSQTNGLAPKLNDSYALVASGPATGTEHTQDMGGGTAPDPWANDEYADAETHDNMEWTLSLKAPSEAHGFGFKYVFFSEEYDDFIGTTFNDKFYVFIEAGSTNGGARSIINFTACREPDSYFDFQCGAGQTGCQEGARYCYIAINSAFSDCCWYNGCPQGTSAQVGTKIDGTGFECATGQMMDGPTQGSSTGWLQTTWPILPDETFTLVFHIHDTGDGIFDSEVILDSFQFLYDSTVPETTPVE